MSIHRFKVHTTYTTTTSDWKLADIWNKLMDPHSGVDDLEFRVANIKMTASFRDELSYMGKFPGKEYDPENPRVHLKKVVLLKSSGLWWPCGYYDEFVAKISDHVRRQRES